MTENRDGRLGPPESDLPGEARRASKGGRNYVPKGMGNGGRRPGAGRPKGSKNALPLGAVSAIRALNLRVPDNAKPEAADLANEALETVVAVMRGEERSPGLAFARLASARAVREEVCGKVADKSEITGKDGGALEVVIRDLSKEQDDADPDSSAA